MEAGVLHNTYYITHFIDLAHDMMNDPAQGIFQMSCLGFSPRLRVKKTGVTRRRGGIRKFDAPALREHRYG